MRRTRYHSRIIFFLCLVSVFSVSTISIAQVYKWVDQNGKVHYSDTKPAGSNAEEVELVDDTALDTTNTFESQDDGVDVEKMKKDRVQREQQRQKDTEERLTQEAKIFQENNCYTKTEEIRRGNAGGGTRVIGTQEVKRCNSPIPEHLRAFLPDYTYQTPE